MMKIVFVSWENPTGKLHGGGVRKRSLAAILESLGHVVEFVDIPQRATGEQAGAHLARLGRIKRHYLPLPLTTAKRSRLPEDLLDGLRGADLVITSLPFVALELIHKHSTRVWMDFWDSWYRMAALESSYRTGIARITTRAQAASLFRAHRQIVDGASITTYAGFGDFADFPASPASRWLPTAVDRPTNPRSGEPRQLSGATSGFIANFHYWPNKDAATHLVDSWLPRLREMGVSIKVAGFGSEDVSWPPEVEVLGEIPSVAAFYRSIDVSLVPVRRGGGVKVKAIESLRWGVPVIADEHALDGFSPSVRGHIVRWDDAHPATQLRADPLSEDLAVFDLDWQSARVAELLERFQR